MLYAGLIYINIYNKYYFAYLTAEHGSINYGEYNFSCKKLDLNLLYITFSVSNCLTEIIH